MKLPCWLIWKLRSFAYRLLDWADGHCRHDEFEWEEMIGMYCCTGCGSVLQDKD